MEDVNDYWSDTPELFKILTSTLLMRCYHKIFEVFRPILMLFCVIIIAILKVMQGCSKVTSAKKSRQQYTNSRNLWVTLNSLFLYSCAYFHSKELNWYRKSSNRKCNILCIFHVYVIVTAAKAFPIVKGL